ncbi:MAG: DNA polymerase II large subunit, partial [Candidatus Thorarchaeota archaeon]
MNQINQNEKLSVNIQEYFDSINKDLGKIYSKAKEARKKGLDPSLDVEIPIAKDIADRVEGLIGPKGIGEKIRKYEKANLSRERVAFKIAEDICEDAKSVDIKEKEMIAEQALRTSLAVITESITAAPLEGIAKVKIKRNEDGSNYFAVYYAGPIRSAGGTAAGISILLADFIRKKLGLGKFQPTQREVERYLEEIELYNRVSHLQLPTSKDEQRFAAQQLPIEITGEPTDKVEVTGNRDLKRVETNRLRGGACLVFNDGLIGRSKKLHSRIAELGLEEWNWLDALINIHVKEGTFVDEGVTDKYDVDEGDEVETEEFSDAEEEVVSDVGYIKDVIGGRPVFAHPSEKGGFRIRYGRSRTTGLASMGVHPALMGVVDDFLACGTHVRTERPGKGAIVMPVDTIHPPIVKLKNGDVIKVQSYKEACEVRKDIEEIIFLGDMLYGAGEFNQNNYNLVPSGYCEEWWSQELEESLMDIPDSKRNSLTKSLEKTISSILKNPFHNIPEPDIAIELSQILDIPLHPEYTYHWSNISLEDFSLSRKYVNENMDVQNQQLRIPNEDKIKQILENLCVPHKIIDGFITLENHSFPLLLSLG